MKKIIAIILLAASSSAFALTQSACDEMRDTVMDLAQLRELGTPLRDVRQVITTSQQREKFKPIMQAAATMVYQSTESAQVLSTRIYTNCIAEVKL